LTAVASDSSAEARWSLASARSGDRRRRSRRPARAGPQLEAPAQHAKPHRAEAPHLATLELHDFFVWLVVPLRTEDPDGVLAWSDVVQRHRWRPDLAAVHHDVKPGSDGGNTEPRRRTLFAAEHDVVSDLLAGIEDHGAIGARL
jgi:hypothetical protein